MRLMPWALLLGMTGSLFAQDQAPTGTYLQTNLVSDQTGVATHTDPRLVNAWGIAFVGTGPWWVNSAGKGLSLIYSATGASGGSFTIPPAASEPTGIVSNTTTDFQVVAGHPALFLFCTTQGTIAGWYTGTSAVTKITTPNAAYTGLTIGTIAGKNYLFAANFANGTVDAFDAAFHPVTLPTGAYLDPAVPPGYAPFNVQNIAGAIYVTWAKVGPTGDDVPGPGLGYVDKFSASGTLLMHLQHGNWLNAPWGLVAAPASGFGPMSGHILVGNFGNGTIAGFNPTTGAVTGLMKNTAGGTLSIPGLWGIRFGNGVSAGPATSLFFAAGPAGETHGLFGTLTAH